MGTVAVRPRRARRFAGAASMGENTRRWARWTRLDAGQADVAAAPRLGRRSDAGSIGTAAEEQAHAADDSLYIKDGDFHGLVAIRLL